MIEAYPLCWPAGWPRSKTQKSANFSRRERQYYSNGTGSYTQKRELSVAYGVNRVLFELEKLGIERQDIIISTNVPTRLDGIPRSGVSEPSDHGVAVYWQDRKGSKRVMAVDRYDRVADNLAAIAATLDALRSIDRHGGGAILDRAFTGFTALPSPDDIAAHPDNNWRQVLGVPDCNNFADAHAAYKFLRSIHHPDKGGDPNEFYRINRAIAAAEQELAR